MTDGLLDGGRAVGLSEALEDGSDGGHNQLGIGPVPTLDGGYTDLRVTQSHQETSPNLQPRLYEVESGTRRFRRGPKPVWADCDLLDENAQLVHR